MQAIMTKYHGPTDTRGSRYSASAQAGRVCIDSNDELNFERNHKAAAKALAMKLGWEGNWYFGFLPDGRGVAVQGEGINGDAPSFVVEAHPGSTRSRSRPG
jgi:hypothetical protein